MLTGEARKLNGGEEVKFFMIPNLKIGCMEWDEQRYATLDKLRENGIDFHTQGTHKAAETWPVTLKMSDEARKILEESPVEFDASRHFPGLS